MKTNTTSRRKLHWKSLATGVVIALQVLSPTRMPAIATEGATHSSSITPAPCSKQEIKFTGQGGASAQLFGLTDNAKRTTDLFTKTYSRWDPPRISARACECNSKREAAREFCRAPRAQEVNR